MLLEKGPWSDSLGALVHGRGFYDQFDSDFWENKYRWCFDGDGADGGDGEGSGGVDDSGEVGGPGESHDDAGPDDSGAVGGYNSPASLDAVSGASPGYGGPGVEAPSAPGIDVDALSTDVPNSIAFGPEEEENSFFESLVNSVLGTPVTALAGTVVGGPIGWGIGMLANYGIEEAFGPSFATDTFGNTLGISSNNEGLASAAMDAVGIASLSDSLGSFSSSSSSSETSGPGVGGAPDSSDLGSPAGGDDVFLNQPLGLAALSPSTVLGVADTTNLNDVTPSWSPANFQRYSGVGGFTPQAGIGALAANSHLYKNYMENT